MAAADGCALSVPGLKDALSLNRRAPPPNVSVKKSDVHVGNNIYCQGTVNMYVDTSSPDIIKNITNRKPVTVKEGWRGWLEGLTRKQKAIYLTAISIVGVLLLFVCIYFPLVQHVPKTDEVSEEYAVVNRSMWLAKGRDSRPVGPPVDLVLVTDTEFSSCSEGLACASIVAHLQKLAKEDGLPDLPYHFLVGGNGRVYEGLGWPRSEPMSLAFIGGFTKRRPPDHQTAAALTFLRQSAVPPGPLRPDYALSLGPCPRSPYRRPGPRLSDLVLTWPHYINASDHKLCTVELPSNALDV